jgi:hypothetical protein
MSKNFQVAVVALPVVGTTVESPSTVKLLFSICEKSHWARSSPLVVNVDDEGDVPDDTYVGNADAFFDDAIESP